MRFVCALLFLSALAAFPARSETSVQAAPDLAVPASAEVSQEETLAQTTGFEAMMSAIREQEWVSAELAAISEGAQMQTLVAWHRLRAGAGTFDEYLAFFASHADWPGLALMHDRGERSIGYGESPERVLAYFDGAIPKSGLGVLRLIEAHEARGETGDAEALTVLAWRSRTMNASTEAKLLDRYEKLLAPHHEARLDDLLWRDQRTTALRQMGRVGDDWKALAKARRALRTRAAGVDGLIEAVPEKLRNDPGLAWERYNWRIRKRLHETAQELLEEHSTSAEALGRPEMWSNYRRIYARQHMRAGRTATAYKLASQHFLTEGSDYADLEWLSGFIALRQLDDPELALYHFQRFSEAVETPISLGRAGYWIGRAWDAAGAPEKAMEAWIYGAQYQTSYYGLLSAEAAGLPMDPTLTGAETFPDWRSTSFAKSEVLSVGLRLMEEGERALAERFLTHLSESLDRKEAGALGQLVLGRGDPHIALKIAKRVAQRAIMIPHAYYPMHPMAKEPWPVSTELALSIARRESEFDPVVISPAGARGLMQLMPGTAQDVAGELGIAYSKSRLTEDPTYNATLGTNYLAGLTEIFGDAPVLISVGYNAGPGRAVNWVSDYGDPRYPGTDVVDWVEMIPFRETRNYVMRVTESLPVYQARLTGKTGPVEFTRLLRGKAD